MTMSEGKDPGNFLEYNGAYKASDNDQLNIFMKDFLLAYGLTPQKHIDDNYNYIKAEMIEECSKLGLKLNEEDDKEVAMIFMRANKKDAPIPVDTHGLLFKHKDKYKGENGFYLLVHRGGEHYYIKSMLFTSESEIIVRGDSNISLSEAGYNPFAQLSKGMRGVEPLSESMANAIRETGIIIDQNRTTESD